MAALKQPVTNQSGTTSPRDHLAGLPSREEISAYHLIDEKRLVGGLVERAVYSEDERRRSAEIARRLVQVARANHAKHAGVDAFMREYGLSSDEGVILMCLAESLLRIPDTETADALIAEKIAGGRWEKHLGASDSMFVNASTWGLMLSGRIVKFKDAEGVNPFNALKRLVARSGEPVIRQAVRQAVKILGDQFVLGRTIKEAIERAEPLQAKGYRFSYDMLGEAARSEADAKRYFDRYMKAIDAIGKSAGKPANAHSDLLMARPGISVKLSALHARFEAGKEMRLTEELAPRLLTLLKAARAQALAVTIDAEEQNRLEPLLDQFAIAFTDPALEGWDELGIAVQAYGRRAVPVLRWLRALAERSGRRIPVRLVKGAYWDSEIKWAQERGLADYPVFTRKLHTDVSYLACTRLLLAYPKAFYPQFATHNAHTLAAVHVAGGNAAFEFQRLHGMGEALYDEVVGDGKLGRPARIYAPVGGHEDLLAYLVRRLLENGANTSFVHRLADAAAPIADIVRDPVEMVEREHESGRAAASALPLPREIYAGGRPAAQGLPLYDAATRASVQSEITAALANPFEAGPIVDGEITAGGDNAYLALCPHDRRERIGSIRETEPAHIEQALASANASAHAWDRLGGDARATILEHAADLFERDRSKLMAVIVREAGKTLENALGDVREAVDFLRYYAGETRRAFAGPIELQGPTGERNTIEWRGRGVIACISPWNFPLAIFTGQVAAALAAGNCVVAKPAQQTPITAMLAVRLLHEAGVPKSVLHLLRGWRCRRGAGERPPHQGHRVHRLEQDGMAHPARARGSPRCHHPVHRRDRRHQRHDRGFERATRAGRPRCRSLGLRQRGPALFRRARAFPAIRCRPAHAQDADRRHRGTRHRRSLRFWHRYWTRYRRDGSGRAGSAQAQDAIRRTGTDRQAAPQRCRAGTYVTPAAYEIASLDVLDHETFGPILHVVRYDQGHLADVIEAINASGYGLTLGLHSRVDLSRGLRRRARPRRQSLR